MIDWHSNRELIDWLANGERGLSSNGIVSHLTGIVTMTDHWPPLDPSDLRRCRLLLERVPELSAEFSRMSSASRLWAAMVPAWDRLCALMDEECPAWRDKPNPCSARRTFVAIKSVLDSAMAAS